MFAEFFVIASKHWPIADWRIVLPGRSPGTAFGDNARRRAVTDLAAPMRIPAGADALALAGA